MDALWFKFPEIARYLLGRGAGLNLSTHYGFSLKEHFEYELNVNTIARNGCCWRSGTSRSARRPTTGRSPGSG